MGLRDANQNFARLVRIVRGGGEVTLMDRGRPIAVVKPLRTGRSLLDALAMRGLLQRARKPGKLPRFRPVRIRGGLSSAVLADRRARG